MINGTRTYIVGALVASTIVLAACSSGPTNTPSATNTPAATVAVQAEQPTEAATVAAQPTATSTSEPTAETQVEQPTQTAQPASLATASEAAQPATPAIVKLNLNTATGEQFLTVLGVGNRMVREFEEYRPYVSIQQFRREIGKYVDQAQVAECEKYIFVPVSPSDADAETLQQMPGVDAAIAEQLSAARPYADRAAFLDKLSQLILAEQFAVAETYVEAE